MKSKLALWLTPVPCVAILVASALALAVNPQSSQTGRDPFDSGLRNNGAIDPTQRNTGAPAGGQRYGKAAYRDARAALGSIFLSPEDAELANHVEGLVRQLGDAKSDADKEKIKAELSEALEKQFDQRQKRHEHELAELEAKVKKLKDLVTKRQEKRREIVSKRLDQILRDAEGLGW